MSSTGTNLALVGLLDLLEQTMRDWRAHDRRTTTAGITSALLAGGDFDVSALGLASREEFWREAEAAGVVERKRLPNGHWYLVLPGEAVPEDLLAPPPRQSSSPTAGSGDDRSDDVPAISPARSGAHGAVSALSRRMRTDVWNAFVDWEGSYRRFWDRTHLRAFLVPAEWAPPAPDADRFAEIEPATFAIQIGWMHDFASQQIDVDRVALEASLAEGAPRGAFRRELEARGLSGKWRQQHRARVADLVTAWAIAFGINVEVLGDSRSADTQTPGAVSRFTAHRSLHRSQSPSTLPTTSSPSSPVSRPVRTHGATGQDPEPDDLALLRARMHLVLDSMSFDEIAALPVRAAHLLRH